MPKIRYVCNLNTRPENVSAETKIYYSSVTIRFLQAIDLDESGTDNARVSYYILKDRSSIRKLYD